MGDTLRNVPVLANQTTRVVFTHAIPPTTVTSWKPNLAATISQIHVTVPAPVSVPDALALVRAAATESGSLSVRVAPASQRSTVCTTGISYGPFTVSLDGWVVDVQQDCAAATANFAGPWSGNYTCTDTCINAPFGGRVQLTVTQDSTGKASYTDEGGTTFSGTVCGDEFRFVHNAADETERGSLRLTGSNAAQKTSTWLHSTLLCGGVCKDTLARR
jgi:hypothetical protein